MCYTDFNNITRFVSLKSKSILFGAISSSILVVIYFVVLTLVSGFDFALSQFSDFWYFIVSLAIGFGVQVGMYSHLRGLIKGDGNGKILGVTGTTSTAAMISCCTHYFANVLPILGTAGIVTFVSQYQVEFFWIGLLFNLGGIVFIASRLLKYKREL